jgi:hypothetical protein
MYVIYACDCCDLFQRSNVMKHLLVAATALTLLAGAAQTASAQPGFNHGAPGHDWHKGGRIERADWNRGQVVDYRRNHLRQPPRGYQWRQVDGNYVLAAAAGGLIADMIVNAR